MPGASCETLTGQFNSQANQSSCSRRNFPSETSRKIASEVRRDD